MATQSTNFTATNTPINGSTFVTAEAVATDLLNLINDYNNPVGGNKIDIPSVLGLIYPIGSIYTNASVATNPATLLGFGTWTAFGTGQVLVGVDTGQAEFVSLGLTGGAKAVAADLAPHAHDEKLTILSNTNSGGTGQNLATDSASATGKLTASAGAGGGHNNLQPYITVYMWLRTA